MQSFAASSSRMFMNNKMAVNQANIWAGQCMPVLEGEMGEELFIICILGSDKNQGR